MQVIMMLCVHDSGMERTFSGDSQAGENVGNADTGSHERQTHDSVGNSHSEPFYLLKKNQTTQREKER